MRTFSTRRPGRAAKAIGLWPRLGAYGRYPGALTTWRSNVPGRAGWKRKRPSPSVAGEIVPADAANVTCGPATPRPVAQSITRPASVPAAASSSAARAAAVGTRVGAVDPGEDGPVRATPDDAVDDAAAAGCFPPEVVG